MFHLNDVMFTFLVIYQLSQIMRDEISTHEIVSNLLSIQNVQWSISIFFITLSIPVGHVNSEGLTGIEEIGCIGGGTSPTGSSPSSPFDVKRLFTLWPTASEFDVAVSNWFASPCAARGAVELPPPLPPILLPIPDSAVPVADPAAES